jgi:hypothetical protein
VAGYYYFIATLPFPLFGQKPGIAFPQFMEQAKIHLLPADFAELESFLEPDPAVALTKTTNPSARRFLSFDVSLRNRLAELRAARLKSDAEKYLRTGFFDAAAARVARAAYEDGNPQKAEETILRARFEAACDLEVGHSFDLDAVLLYSMKLKIAEERSNVDQSRGRESFERELAKALEKH